MTSPGVSTKPIKLISGNSPFCETFFDNVKVPRENLVWKLNDGWTVAKYLLTHEREMIGAIGERSAAKPVGRVAAEALGTDATGRLADPTLRADIARFEVDEAAFRAWMRLVGEQARAGEAHPAVSSALKFYGAELNKRRWELMMALGGADALEWEGARSNGGAAARTWLRTKANSIEGGTSEVQLNVVAKRILGLPGA
jgi:acyl-CoA dehydrogenase